MGPGARPAALLELTESRGGLSGNLPASGASPEYPFPATQGLRVGGRHGESL